MRSVYVYRITYWRCDRCNKVYWSSPARRRGRLRHIHHLHSAHEHAVDPATAQYRSFAVYCTAPIAQHAS